MSTETIYNQNLLYLQKHIPQLHAIIQSINTQHLSININQDGANISKNNQHIYPENSNNYLTNQIENFCIKPPAFYKFPTKIKPHPEISPIHDKYLTKIESIIPKQCTDKSKYDTHLDSIPLLLLIGVGTGQEIVQLIQLIDIKKIIIIDQDFSMIKASMHIILWEEIFNYFSKESYSLEFKISPNAKPLSLDVLNHIFQSNVYYSHYIPYFTSYKNSFLEDILNHLGKNYNLLFNGWGFYDDEITSLQHTITNINNKQPFFTSSASLPKNSKVFIIGSGPSLDEDIENIKKHQHSTIIISCGTASIPLEANGIIPDYHIEIERPYSTYTRLLEFNSKEFLKQINFIGLNVIYPETFNLFKTSGLFFRNNDCGASIVSNTPKLNHCNPTVVNGALSFASYIGFENIYLFGTDMGYKDVTSHHSKHSVYKDNSSSYYGWKPNTIGVSFPQNFNKNETLFSSDILSWAKQRVENCIKDYKIQQNKNITYYNCSDGAFIENTVPIHSSEINIQQNKATLLKLIKRNFKKNDIKIKNTIKSNLIQEKRLSNETIDTILSILNINNSINSYSQLFETLDKIFKIINNNKNSIVYSLTSGTIISINKTIYTYSLQAVRIEESFEFINDSFCIMADFLDEVKNKLNSYSIN